MSSPLDSHWQAVKRILRYVGTNDMGLHLQQSKFLELSALCDADRVLTQLIGALQLIFASILVPTSFLGFPRSNLSFRDPPQRQSIAPLLLQLLRSLGYSHCCPSYMFLALPHLLWFIAITSTLSPLLPIQCCTLEPNIWSQICT